MRLGWPNTEWKTGPEPKMAGEMAGGHFSGVSQNGQKNRRNKELASQNLRSFCLSGFIFRPFWDPPPEKWPPAFSLAILSSGPVSHSVAGQPIRKAGALKRVPNNHISHALVLASQQFALKLQKIFSLGLWKTRAATGPNEKTSI